MKTIFLQKYFSPQRSNLLNIIFKVMVRGISGNRGLPVLQLAALLFDLETVVILVT
jgi:hypothetical protein